ncbi:MAG TPA: type II toxin-antitoxin system VapC family toxin [Thermoanaerobaculia bacterium]|nr:type II toxin-antitoxin system VapC family toxin [Thermoanaerobaculia bacterium]
MIFVDSNIPMYLIGRAHPNKEGARRLLEGAAVAGERLVTNAEVLQEILHRYDALGQRQWIQPAFDALLGVVDEVLPVELADLERAKNLLHSTGRLSARDALHLAVMQRYGIATIMTYDAGFDGLAGVGRLST